MIPFIYCNHRFYEKTCNQHVSHLHLSHLQWVSISPTISDHNRYNTNNRKHIHRNENTSTHHHIQNPKRHNIHRNHNKTIHQYWRKYHLPKPPIWLWDHSVIRAIMIPNLHLHRKGACNSINTLRSAYHINLSTCLWSCHRRTHTMNGWCISNRHSHRTRIWAS